MTFPGFTGSASLYSSANSYSWGARQAGADSGMAEPAARLRIICYRRCKKYVCGGVWRCNESQLEQCQSECTY